MLKLNMIKKNFFFKLGNIYKENLSSNPEELVNLMKITIISKITLGHKG